MNGRHVVAALNVVNAAHRIATATAAVADAESRPWDYRASADLRVASGSLRVAQSDHSNSVARWADLGVPSTPADYLTALGFDLPE